MEKFNIEKEKEKEKEELSMTAFLAQIFTKSEATTYAAILSGLGVDLPKDLGNVSQVKNQHTLVTRTQEREDEVKRGGVK
jgi:hypothetical protein